MSEAKPWRPSLGAWPEAGGVRFRVWAPEVRAVDVVREGTGTAFPLEKDAEGFFGGLLSEVRVGDRYRYRVDGGGPFPDPASRFQPEGVHGPSEFVDPSRFAWSDDEWSGVTAEDLVLYEMHIGTFSPAGTFAGATERLPWLKDLGVTALELMPVADFPGRRGWGYDGVDLFAPARCYGTPDDLRRLVDRAHRLGLAVVLDVVYNHLGPAGNYLAQFSPYYFGARPSPWGPAINLDGPHSGRVREFLIENALHWVHEYHLDGFRLDATHHLHDESPRHFLAELAARVRTTAAGRAVHIIAEDPRNLAHLVKAEAEGGWGLDGVWSDDFHHELRRFLVGDSEGLFRDFRGTMADVAVALNRGWLICGAYSIHRGYHRGSDPSGIPPRRFVFCIQNHDRIGNRALGERLNHQVDLATYRAATALLLVAPATPLLFMGQEWAATSPFRYFTDHEEGLGHRVREGRLHEFRHYAAFSDSEQLARIPDIQAVVTFLDSKLDWSEPGREPHAATVRLYRALLGLRRAEPALRMNQCGSLSAVALDAETLLLRRDSEAGPSLWLVVRLRGEGMVSLEGYLPAESRCWECVMTTEDLPFATDPMPPQLDRSGHPIAIQFVRPAAVLLRAVPAATVAQPRRG